MKAILLILLALMLVGCAGLSLQSPFQWSSEIRTKVVNPALKDDNKWMSDIQKLSIKGAEMNDCKAGLANGLHVVSVPTPGLKLTMIELTKVADQESPAYKACYGTAVWWIYKAEEAKSVGQKFIVPTVEEAAKVLSGL